MRYYIQPETTHRCGQGRGNGCSRMTPDWNDISEPEPPPSLVTAAHLTHGPIIPPQQQLLLYSADQWESFVQEWAHYCLTRLLHFARLFEGDPAWLLALRGAGSKM